MSRSEERFKNELAKTKLELEYYKGFYVGIKSIIAFLQDDKKADIKAINIKQDNIEHFIRKINEREEK